MILSSEIMNVFDSSEYRRELEELSSYAANIKQERPMVLLLCKHLYSLGYKLAMEQNKIDLVADGTSIEFKFHYDFDITFKLQKELNRYSGEIEQVWRASQAKEISKTWSVMPGIYKDVLKKSPDIFIWVIYARDLSGISDIDLNRICLSSMQKKFNKDYPYESNYDFLTFADSFLQKLQRLRQFTVTKTTLKTKGIFPSTYHIRICEFNR